MKSPKLQDAMNQQIQAELYSAYMYLAMSTYCQSRNLPGFANWLRVQYQEESEHAMKLLKYMEERGVQVKLMAIDAPALEYGSPLNVFEKVLAHEQHVTASIHNLYEVALEAKDYAAQSFLKWFIDEQVEEEASAGEIVEKLKMIGDHPGAIFFIDRELAGRE